MYHGVPHASENEKCMKFKYGKREGIILSAGQAVLKLYRTGTNLYNRVNNNSRFKEDKNRLLSGFSIKICANWSGYPASEYIPLPIFRLRHIEP